MKRSCFHIKSLLHDIAELSTGTMVDTQTDLLILYSMTVRAIPKKSPSITPVRWYPPSPSWVKLNTDGLAKGNPGPAVAAGIFRSCRGFVKGICT